MKTIIKDDPAFQLSVEITPGITGASVAFKTNWPTAARPTEVTQLQVELTKEERMRLVDAISAAKD